MAPASGTRSARRGTGGIRHGVARVARAVAEAVVTAPVTPPRGVGWVPKGGPARPLVIAAMVLFGLGQAGGAIPQYIVSMGVSGWSAALLGTAQTLPVALAWRSPLLAWRITTAALLIGVFAVPAATWPFPVTSALAQAVVLFLVALSHPARTVLGVGVTAAGLVGVAALVNGLDAEAGLALSGLILLILLAGRSRADRDLAEVRLAEAERRHREDRERQAVLAERTRIARELHDVVAHHMSVVAIQAQAAPYKISDLSAPARETFVLIHASAREALTEMRRMVGLLRDDGETAERVPQPGISRIPELIDRARLAGLEVEYVTLGRCPGTLPSGVDVSVYRIAQEALSNVARHATGARVRVELLLRPGRIRVAVTDTGPAPGAGAEAGPESGPESGPEAGEPRRGHGLTGMRERVAMLGGTLVAGPRRAGGFAVVAEIPLTGPGGAGSSGR